MRTRAKDQEAAEAAVAHLLTESLLPAWLDPTRRERIHEGLAFMWCTASPNKRRWVRQCWDAIGYDYRWLMSD